ncbi:MAG: ABC transporter ATP-binding protein [Myxococcota bacterium]
MTEAVAVARGVTRRFATRTVIEDVDLHLRPGEIVGLIGPNGGGKSTLLLLLAGLLRPSAGEVRVAGEPAHVIATQQSGAVGLITAEPGLYPLLTGRENLRFFAGLYGERRTVIDARIEELAGGLGLAEVLDRQAATYSSGMRQKVSLVRALLLRPRLLLLDEPTSHLDPLSTRRIHEAVRGQADQGVAVMLVTHDLHAAEQICDRVLAVHRRLRGVEVLGEGRVPTPSRLHDLFEAAADPVEEAS